MSQPRHFFAKTPGRVYAKMPRKPKLDDTQCGFCRGRSTTEEISTLHQTFKKSWEHAKDVSHVSSTSGKYIAVFLVKSFG